MSRSTIGLIAPRVAYGFTSIATTGSRRATTATWCTPWRAGVLVRERVTELGAVLAGEAEGRRHAREATAFDSTGLAIQDLAIALAALERLGELDGVPTIDL